MIGSSPPQVGGFEVASVILTRPGDRNMALAQALAAHGVHCLDLPALQLLPTTNPMPAPQGFDLILFVSGFAAQRYLHAHRGTWPRGVLAAGVGAGTLHVMRTSGVIPAAAAIAPGQHTRQDSEALWQMLQDAGIRPQRVLIVRGCGGRDWLRAQWQNTGVEVEDTVAYHRVPCVWTQADGQVLRAARSACVLLVTSSSSARAIDANLRRLGLTHLWGQWHVLAVHARIAACVQAIQKSAGIAAPYPIVLSPPDTPGVLQALLALVRTL